VWYIEALDLLYACGESSRKEVLSKIEEALSKVDDQYSKTVKRRRESDDRTMQGRFQSLEGAHFALLYLLYWHKRTSIDAESLSQGSNSC
jgi:hypothetical protein